MVSPMCHGLEEPIFVISVLREGPNGASPNGGGK